MCDPRNYAATAEPAWHRNERAKRARARKASRTARVGGEVDPCRVADAQRLLAAHHGTRGQDGSVMPKPKWNDWQCTNCTGEREWNFEKKSVCHFCGGGKPRNPMRFYQCNGGAGGGGGKKGGGKGKGDSTKGGGKGGKGGSEYEQLRSQIESLRTQIHQSNQNERWKKNEEAKNGGRDTGERNLAASLAEFDARKGGGAPADSTGTAADDTGDGEPKQADLAEESAYAEEVWKDAAKRFKAHPERPSAKKDCEDAKETLDAARKAVRDSKDPEERVVKKSQQISRLKASRDKLCEKFKAEIVARDKAEKEFNEHNDEVQNLSKLIKENRVQTEQLRKEACEVISNEQHPQEMVDGIGRYMQEVSTKFDDPLLQEDSTVAAQKVEMERVRLLVLDGINQYEAYNKRISEAQVAARAKANAEAESKTKEAEAARKIAENAAPRGNPAPQPASTGSGLQGLRPSGGRGAASRGTLALSSEAWVSPTHEREVDEVLLEAKPAKLAKKTGDDLDTDEHL